MITILLSKLKVKLPAGAPVIYDDRPWTVANTFDDEIWIVASDGSGCSRYVDAARVSLDLTTPAIPRVDGATVAATKLAEAAGLDVSQGVTWQAERIEGEAHVRILDTRGCWHGIDGPKTSVTEPRDILAVVFLAVLGVKP